jgi:renal tumor antigen
LIKDD